MRAPAAPILAASAWQMTLGERCALEGLLSQIKPALAIEIGTAEGGSLARVAAHSERVHSFDLVRPNPSAETLPNVTFHTGDSHELLPRLLGDLAGSGEKVDFVLVDGDHTPDGVERDVRDLLASEAIRETVILLHDTLNDDVRRGLRAVDYDAEPKVAYVDLDFVGGHLSKGGPYHNELWGGLGLIVVDVAEGARERFVASGFHDLFGLVSPVRAAIVAREREGSEGADLLAHLDWLQTRLAGIERSTSWRATAPLRMAKRALGPGRR